MTLDNTLDLREKGVSAYKGKSAEVGKLSEFLEAVGRGKVRRGSYLVIESLNGELARARDRLEQVGTLMREFPSATLAREAQQLEVREKGLDGLLSEARAKAAHPLSEAWKEGKTLLIALERPPTPWRRSYGCGRF